jgi:Holliday junction resolvase RusA-like endonuclease
VRAPWLIFEVPGEPVPWQRVARGRGGRAYVPEETADYQQSIAIHALQARQLFAVGKTPWPMDARYKVELTVVRSPRARRSDLDNYAKTVGDGANGVVWDDDSQIDEWRIVRAVGGRPHIRVHVTVVDGPESTTPLVPPLAKASPWGKGRHSLPSAKAPRKVQS